MPIGPGQLFSAPAAQRVPIRWQTVRRQFDRRAARFGLHDALVREVSRRLIDRLDYMRIAPRRILDVGCGAGHSRAPLHARFPKALWVGADMSLPMLHAGRGARSGWAGWIDRLRGQVPAMVCGEAADLPLADSAFELVLSNLMLHWHPAPHDVFVEWKRVLAVDGLLLFSCFGPDTLKELRDACAEALPRADPMPFIDMHDFGDMMVGAGLATPVMDVETIRLTYASADALLAEARALGGNPRADRNPGLHTGGRALRAALERRRDAAGRIPLTFEVAYGHAWRPAPKAATQSVVSVEGLRASLPRLRDAGPGQPEGK
jgi:malonyl-CoA O-methyltransferase